MRISKQLVNTREYAAEINQMIQGLDFKNINEITEIIYRAYKNENSIFIFGNGGSASTASHFACDLGKGTLGDHYNFSKRRLKVFSLTDNVATMTAYGNDLNFDDIFVQQLKNLIVDGDVIIAISGSGNSENVIRAVKLANENRATTIGLLGFDGGKLANMVDHKIIIGSENYGVIEDAHMMLGHMMTEVIKDKVANSDYIY